jgi:guanosine-3',5'-bis(diphosphate) 3'-pyrophosphohydrolase
MKEFIKQKKKIQNIIKAKEFAENAHKDQLYGDHLYIRHLEMVSTLVEPWGETAQVLAYLHDVVEDTPISIDVIKKEFGEEIANYVDLITDCNGKNRKERKLKTNEKLSKINDEVLVLVVKVCDRIVNVGMSIATKNKKLLEMYKKEHEEFKNAVYRKGLCDKLWDLLDYSIQLEEF